MAEKSKWRDVLRRMLKPQPIPHDEQPKFHEPKLDRLKAIHDAIGQKDPHWTKEGLLKRGR